MVGSAHGMGEATSKPDVGIYLWMAQRDARMVPCVNGKTLEVPLPGLAEAWVGGPQSRHLFLVLGDRFLGKAGAPAPLAGLQRGRGISGLPTASCQQ